ncbi:MAG: hypothetical protein LBO63_03500 [Oscillospiraceae bacterium]|jgi:hypothetical protein|nr:hypothetical protein [Oscillospiraceae bacterium]
MSKKKITTLAVTAAIVVALLVGAELGKTQKTILDPGMLDKYTNEQQNS